MHTVRCPACRGDVGVDPNDVGHAVSCPLCGDVFTPQGDFPPAPPREEADRPPPPPDDRPSLPRIDDEADLDRPSRGRRRTRRSDAELAEAAVRMPANGLIWTGIVCAVLSVIGGLFYAGLGLAELNGQNAPREDGWVMIALGGAATVIGVPYFLVMSAGGRQLKRLDGGTALVYAAAVLGIATVALCGVCVPTTWAAITFGIWALVALSKPEVKAVMAAARGE